MSDAGVQEEPDHKGTQTNTDDSASRPVKQRQNSIDRDAQDMVIDSLRAQIQDLISQVSQLNNKLVKSYDRVSDLEDDLHVASANVRSSSVKISQLELERTQHLSALNTGLLVEKSHVTSELTRLMEKATEEAAQRGQAESARLAIEKDLDDLSATLFGQANSMVAEARYDKHLSERKVEEAERALKSAEEVVQLMQTQMQALQAEKEGSEKSMREMEQIMGKGKWVETRNGTPAATLRLMSMHNAYQEYLSFITHLRVLHPTSPTPPAMTTLLQLSFLQRLLTEDSEPTVRLDLAPSLNWLSRRSVLTAIHSGQLTIEPISTTTLFAESSAYPSTTVAGMNSTHDNISCALCGVPVFPINNEARSPAPSHTTSQTSWSGSFFKRSLSGSLNGTQPSSPTHPTHRDSISTYLNSQIFIFRMASLPSASISSLPISLAKSSSQLSSSPIPSSVNGSYTNTQSGTPILNNQPTTIYPLCTSGWCLMRLRTTCTLWAFVRTGIVDRIWEEELPPPPPPPPVIPVEGNKANDKPPIPPRKRGIWGIASALGERAASWSGVEEDKIKKTTGNESNTPPTNTTTSHPLPPAPPTHPTTAHATSSPRRMPPPLPPLNGHAPKPSAAPPPLPKRNSGRSRPLAAPEKPTTGASQSTVVPLQSDAAIAQTEASPKTSLEVVPTQDAPVVPIDPASHPLPESRPATPTAPPIPRRAAARARPAPGGSRPTTPANLESTPAASASTESLGNDVKETVKEGVEPKQENTHDEKPKVNGHDHVVEVNVEGPETSTVSEDKGTHSDSSTRPSLDSNDAFVDAPEQTEEVQNISVPPSESVLAPETTQEAGEDVDDKATVIEIPLVDKPDLSIDTAGDGTEEISTPLVSEELTEEPLPEHDGDEKAALEAARLEEEAEEEKKRLEKEEKYKAGYVGDGTWEEKTWKELVRLREDMFWARIGGFRD